MLEIIKDYWEWLLGIVGLLVGGWHVPFIRVIYVAAIKAMMSEKVLKAVFINFAEKLVKSTKNPLDDIWFEQLKKELK